MSWPPAPWDVWFADLRSGGPTEQTGRHNVVVLSHTQVPSGVALVAPITSTAFNVACAVEIEAIDAGIRSTSWIQCDQIQALAISKRRFLKFRRKLAHPRRPELAAALSFVLRGIFPPDLLT